MFKRRKQELKKYLRQRRNISRQNIRFFNFWNIDDIENHWFHQFCVARNICTQKKKINFFSVVGPKYYVKIPITGKKIFFTGENVQGEHHKHYGDHLLGSTDLSMGFDYLNHPKYLRFPLWMLYLVKPTDTLEDIQEKIDKVNAIENRNCERPKFASLICRHDFTNIRGKIVDELSKIEKIECAGDFMNNTSDLRTKYGDNKLKYLRQFKFNICPENTNSEGYVTEKLLESFQSGCIPIYWGSNENPEPEIFNKKAILFYDSENPNSLSEKILELWEDKASYDFFISEKPFKAGAAEKIWNMLNELDVRIRE